MRKLIALSAIVVAGLLGSISSASADSTTTATITSTTKCTDLPSIFPVVIWEVTNNSLTQQDTITVEATTDGLATLYPGAYSIGGGSSSPTSGTLQQGGNGIWTAVQKFVPDAPLTSSTITILNTWPDGTTETLTATQALPAACTDAPAPPQLQTIAPSSGTAAPSTPSTTEAPAATQVTASTIAPSAPQPITTLIPVQHRPKTVKAPKLTATVPQATATHTGEPWAGTGPLAAAVAIVSTLMIAAGLLIRRKRLV